MSVDVKGALAKLGAAMGEPLSPEEYAKRKAEKKQKDMWLGFEKILARSNAPKRHLQTEAVHKGKFAERYQKLSEIKVRGYMVALIGAWGAGKTQLAVEMMKDRATLGKKVEYHTAMELLMMFKATYNNDSRVTEMDVVKALTKPSLLVIDEAAKRGETEWENRLLFEILNKRYGDFKDTILIANQSREEFSKSMGPAIVRRMDEVGGLMVFE